MYFLVNAMYEQTSVPDFFFTSDDLQTSPFLIDGTGCALTADVATVKAIAATNAAAAITRPPVMPRLDAVFMIDLSIEDVV
jgi:Tfp pilus assembly protein PilW